MSWVLDEERRPRMLVAQAAVALVLMIALAVPPRGAATHRGRLFRAQERWAEEMDRR